MSVAVRVIGHSETSRQIAHAIEEARFETSGEYSFAVLADWPDIDTLYRYSEEPSLPWMLIEETGSGGALGPIFSSDGSGCFRCYIGRRRSNGGQECRPLRAASAALIHQIARSVASIAGAHSAMAGEQLEILRDGQLRRHVLVPLPNCERCRRPRAVPRVLNLKSLVGNRIGLVHETHEIPGAPESLKAVVAHGCRTDAFAGARALNRGMAVDETVERAQERAAAESIERYCGALAPDRLSIARASELDGPSLDPSSFSFPDVHLNGQSRFRWVRATSLRTGKEVWAPASLVYVPYTHHQEETILGMQSSVGLAAGRTLEEAIHHALAEIVERDACLRAWRYGLAVERIAAPPFPLEGLHLARVPNDSGLAVVVAFLEQPQPPLTSTGLAARPDLEDAVRHATLEAVLSQIWLKGWIASGQTYSIPPRNMVDHAAAHAVSPSLILSRRHWLYPCHLADAGWKPRSWSDIISRSPEASFVDLTTTDVDAAGLKVVRVLLPGRITADDDGLRPRLGGCVTPHPFG